jgi:hypothetical protein
LLAATQDCRSDVQLNRAPKVQLAASDQKFAPRTSPPNLPNRRRQRQFSEFNAKQFQRAKQLAKRLGREGIEGRHCGNEPNFPLTSNVR